MQSVQRWTERVGKLAARARADAHGGACEACGQRPGESGSHIVPVSLGGSHAPSNLLRTCGDGTRGCHGWLEANPLWATAGGWQIRHTGRRPGQVPVWLRIPYSPAGGWWLLDDDGLYLHHDPDLVPLPLDPAERPDLYVPDGLGGHRPAHLPYEGAAA